MVDNWNTQIVKAQPVMVFYLYDEICIVKPLIWFALGTFWKLNKMYGLTYSAHPWYTKVSIYLKDIMGFNYMSQYIESIQL